MTKAEPTSSKLPEKEEGKSENGTLVDNSKNSIEPTVTKPVETIIKKEEKPVEIKPAKVEEKVEKATEIKTTKPAEKIEEKPVEKKPVVAKVTETKEIAIQTMEEDILSQTTFSKPKAAEVIQKPNANNVEPNRKSNNEKSNVEPNWKNNNEKSNAEPNWKSNNEKTKVETTHSNPNNNVTQKDNKITTVATPTPKQEKESNHKVEPTQKNEGKEKVQEKKSEQKKTENENIQTQEDPSWGNEEIIPSSDNVKITVVV